MKKRYLSLRPYLLWQTKEHPLEWANIFGRKALLEVEIGFGNGEFLTRQALSSPEKNFVGMELKWGSIRRGLRQIAHAGLSNVRLLQIDSRVAFDRLFRPQSVDYVCSLFPMPWPKRHHERNRLFSHNFLNLLNNRLMDKRAVHIVTDCEPYFNWVLEQLPGTGFTVETKISCPQFNTKYERKWQEKGQNKFFEINLVKLEHREISEKKEAALRTYSLNHFDPEKFSPKDERGEIVVKFQDFLFDHNRQRGMVRVIVVEDLFTQDFWIAIESREESWHIKVAPGCEVASTVGVQRALDLVYEAAGDI
ncbi:MAG: tRNA (guanosine(46)-N7)-methyltransferase TrmB [Thermodesulfobacteriota bacterium]|jgi:tRNA (guanine-N7-)-methyltransferase|nr:MAG: tRNA (guanosine(46)-N7)-methyltransferase TrmB [Thermodesulfobacteriota bacterium]